MNGREMVRGATRHRCLWIGRAVVTGFVIGLGSTLACAQQASHEASIRRLQQEFLAPPNAARPMVRWWWFGPAVVKPEILNELQQMKANGIGGAELAFVYPEVLDDPAKDLKNLPFLSPAMLDAVTYAQIEGRKLGLRIDVTLCSGWPYGGPAITLAEAVTRLRTAEVAVPPGANSIASPVLGEGESLLRSVLVDGMPMPPPARGAASRLGPPASTWDAATAKSFTATGAKTLVRAEDKPRVALFFIESHTKQEVKRAAVGAEGYVLDPFSHEAVAKHLKAVGEPLIKAFGTTPPYAIFSDSLEAYGADWTPDLPGEFLKRRGYDLMPHLAELVGGGSAEAEKIRHDYGRTLTELVDENYLTQINDWAIAHHTKFRSQTYGEPAVSFSSQNLVGLAEGEGPQWRAFSTLRWATSANHVFGHDITSGETFTWLHSPVFRAIPLDMKAEADIDFIMGENQLMFHGWPYSPPAHEVPEPGWSLYAAAVFNDHNPWHPVEAAVNKYIARISYLMRQGEPANQVALLLPTDDAWASFSPGHTTVTGAMSRLITPELMSAILSAGYNVDYIDADAIDKIGFGNHQILILPPTDRIPLQTLRRIHAYVEAGGKAISVGRRPSIDPEGKATEELTGLSQALFQSANATFVSNTGELGDALYKAAHPDFEFLGDTPDSAKNSIGFIRRKLPEGDIYFVANTSNQPVNVDINFATKYGGGMRLYPDTGACGPKVANPHDVELSLAPYESRVFVFYDAGSPERDADNNAKRQLNVIDLSHDWKVTFTSIGLSEEEHILSDWIANPKTVHYSGEAVYSRNFTIAQLPKLSDGPVFLEVDGGEALPMPQVAGEHPVILPNGLPDPRVTKPGPGMHAYFDPPVRAAALVEINGKPAGALWHTPYRLDVRSLLKPGENHIEIHVYNTALNAWSALPPHNYGPLIAKYGDRFQMQDLNLVKPISSGILGPIHLVVEGGDQ